MATLHEINLKYSHGVGRKYYRDIDGHPLPDERPIEPLADLRNSSVALLENEGLFGRADQKMKIFLAGHSKVANRSWSNIAILGNKLLISPSSYTINI